jgi:hypothetical protein
VLRWGGSGGGSHIVTGSTALAAGSWHHVACVRDEPGGESRIYVDGALSVTVQENGTGATSAAPLSIGAVKTATSYSQYFDGYVDLVRLSSGATYGASFTPPHDLDPPPTKRIDLAWQGSASAAGYDVYRQIGAGAFELLTVSPIPLPSYSDIAPPGSVLCYRVAAVDSFAQKGADSSPACLQLSVTDAQPAHETEAVLPALRLTRNPSTAPTAFELNLRQPGPVEVVVYNLRGERVATLWNAPLAVGPHTLAWDGRTHGGGDAASGVYWVLLRGPDVHARKKLILLR